jgi:hypothetical protein
MKKFALLLTASAICALLLAHPDEPTPPEHSSFSWHTVTLIDYKPDAEDAAREMVKKFESATLSAGISLPVVHWFENGKYDLVVTWKLDKSPESDHWTWSPESETWWKAFVEQEGSAEAATQIKNNYEALVASSVTKIARKAK